MARKAMNTANSFAHAGLGSGEVVESNAAKCDANFAELDQDVVVVDLTANGTTTVKIAKPVARTISAISAKRHTALASTSGTILLTVKDGDGTTLFNAANKDAEGFTASFVDQTLTDTTADLDIAAGEPIVIALVSNNGDATGGPCVVKITYAAG